MKNIIITGSSRGLGASLRDFLLDKSYCIYGTSRSVLNLRESENLKFIPLDFTEKKSVDSFVEYFFKNNITIDGLIHNAGIAYLDPADVLEEEEIHHIFDVNFFGPIALTRKLLPLMKKSISCRLIFISSIVSIDPWPYLGVYSASKAALESVAFEWAVMLSKWNIKVSVVQPNPLPTNMQILRSKNAPTSPYPELIQSNLQWEKIEYICEIIVQILEDSSPRFLYQTGPHSTRTMQKFIKKLAYEKAIKLYIKKFANNKHR
jgi:NAD(P)-dependent dehydrogenase (short-subunit alcohol dehydrogenase family)